MVQRNELLHSAAQNQAQAVEFVARRAEDVVKSARHAQRQASNLVPATASVLDMHIPTGILPGLQLLDQQPDPLSLTHPAHKVASPKRNPSSADETSSNPLVEVRGGVEGVEDHLNHSSSPRSKQPELGSPDAAQYDGIASRREARPYRTPGQTEEPTLPARMLKVHGSDNSPPLRKQSRAPHTDPQRHAVGGGLSDMGPERSSPDCGAGGSEAFLNFQSPAQPLKTSTDDRGDDVRSMTNLATANSALRDAQLGVLGLAGAKAALDMKYLSGAKDSANRSRSSSPSRVPHAVVGVEGDVEKARLRSNSDVGRIAVGERRSTSPSWQAQRAVEEPARRRSRTAGNAKSENNGRRPPRLLVGGPSATPDQVRARSPPPRHTPGESASAVGGHRQHTSGGGYNPRLISPAHTESPHISPSPQPQSSPLEPTAPPDVVGSALRSSSGLHGFSSSGAARAMYQSQGSGTNLQILTQPAPPLLQRPQRASPPGRHKASASGAARKIPSKRRGISTEPANVAWSLSRETLVKVPGATPRAFSPPLARERPDDRANGYSYEPGSHYLAAVAAQRQVPRGGVTPASPVNLARLKSPPPDSAFAGQFDGRGARGQHGGSQRASLLYGPSLSSSSDDDVNDDYVPRRHGRRKPTNSVLSNTVAETFQKASPSIGSRMFDMELDDNDSDEDDLDDVMHQEAQRVKPHVPTRRLISPLRPPPPGKPPAGTRFSGVKTPIMHRPHEFGQHGDSDSSDGDSSAFSASH